MMRSSLKHVLISRFLACLLIAGLATQWAAGARGMGLAWVRGVTVSSAASADTVDRVLVDIVKSICSKSKKDQAKDDHCLYCVPAPHHLAVFQGGRDGTALAVPVRVGIFWDSQILPLSRRLPGDGPSRAPPSSA